MESGGRRVEGAVGVCVGTVQYGKFSVESAEECSSSELGVLTTICSCSGFLCSGACLRVLILEARAGASIDVQLHF